jgi:hypothetical protein
LHARLKIHPFSVDPVHCDFFWVIVCLGRKWRRTCLLVPITVFSYQLSSLERD